MPYVQHPHLDEPPNDTVLWRYIDIAKLVSLLEDEALYFPAVTVLEDKYEGQLTRPTLENMRAAVEAIKEEAEREAALKALTTNQQTYQNVRRLLFISSWHASERESAAMWQAYLRSNDGVAVQTTFGALKDSLTRAKQDVSGGMVRYIDYEKDLIEFGNLYNWVSSKRLSFEHEQEFRLVVLDTEGEVGLSVCVDVPRLVQKVFVAPTSQAWMAEVVRKLLVRYGLECDVVYSTLLDGPSYLQ